MNLIVDIGNTLVKLAVFDGGRIVAQRCVERLHPSMLGELLEGRRAAKAVVASTRGEADDVVETVRPYADYLLEFTSQTPVPVANAYHTPETLGRDRLAAAVGAAWETARKGDVVVLSPACAAFDRFKNFMERGQAFKRLVQGL